MQRMGKEQNVVLLLAYSPCQIPQTTARYGNYGGSVDAHFPHASIVICMGEGDLHIFCTYFHLSPLLSVCTRITLDILELTLCSLVKNPLR